MGVIVFKQLKKLILLLLIPGMASLCFGAEEAFSVEAEIEDTARAVDKNIEQQEAEAALATEEGPSFKETFIQSNQAIAVWFDGVAEGVDLFIVGKKLTNRPNETYFQITNSTYVRQDEGPHNVTNFAASLRLPNVEEYWQLIFETSDQQKESSSLASDYLKQDPKEKSLGASLGLFRRLGAIRVAVQPRLELQNPLRLSHSLKFESIVAYEGYKVHPKLDFFADASRGVGSFIACNFNFLLSKIHSLTLINEGEYLEKLHQLKVSNGFSVGQATSERSSFAFGMLFNSINRPSYHLENYVASATTTYLIYKNILDLQLTPYLSFPRAESFTGRSGLNFQMNLTF